MITKQKLLVGERGQQKSKISRACIVVPTYNEAKNIVKHLDSVFQQTSLQDPQGKVDFSVLVVDDNSPDGTAQIVQRYAMTNPHVHLLLRRKKEGLGKAYIAGITHAMDLLAPDVIYEMDADGQHNPRDLLRLLETIQEGADFVIGSRYVKGGSIPDSWSQRQRIKSKCANFTVRMILGTKDVKDCSGGFRAIRTSILRKIDWTALEVKGYAFQAVLLEEAIHKGAKVQEIPISFNDRENGVSKMRLNDMIEGFGLFTKIRARRILRR